MSPYFILVAILTAAGVALMIYLIRLIHRLTAVAVELEAAIRNVNELADQAGGVLQKVEAELNTVHSISQRLEGIVADAENVSGQVSKFSLSVVDGLSPLSGAFQQVKAVLSGVQTGVGAFKRFRSERR